MLCAGAGLGSVVVREDTGELRDLAGLSVLAAGSLLGTGSRLEPYVLADPSGEPVEAVAAFFRDLLAAGRSAATVRSYGMDLLRWFRFLWAAGVPWRQATRAEAREPVEWLALMADPCPARARQGDR
jgi:Phage integrase, N-terminal SAM-like domain